MHLSQQKQTFRYKKALLIIGVLMASVSGFVQAQDTLTHVDTKTYFRWELGFSVMPTASFRSYSYQGKAGFKDHPDAEELKEEDKLILGPHIGLTSALFFHPNHGLQVDVMYSLKGFKREAERTEWSWFRYDRNYYELHYIDIPIKYVYATKGRKVRFRTSVGMGANVLIKGTDRKRWASSRSDWVIETDEDINYNAVNLSFIASAGLDIPFRKHMGIRLEPTFQHQLLKNTNDELQARMWSFGLLFTIYFSPNNKS